MFIDLLFSVGELIFLCHWSSVLHLAVSGSLILLFIYELSVSSLCQNSLSCCLFINISPSHFSQHDIHCQSIIIIISAFLDIIYDETDTLLYHLLLLISLYLLHNSGLYFLVLLSLFLPFFTLLLAFMMKLCHIVVLWGIHSIVLLFFSLYKVNPKFTLFIYLSSCSAQFHQVS